MIETYKKVMDINRYYIRTLKEEVENLKRQLKTMKGQEWMECAITMENLSWRVISYQEENEDYKRKILLI